MSSKFIPEVESLRGIAALTVALFHLFRAPDANFTFTQENTLNLIATTLLNGTGAVVLFFVISGFVLGHNIQESQRLTPSYYGSFVLRRAFRLMPALWVSILFAAAISGTPDLLGALLLQDEAYRLNGPLWSLKVEVLASLLFPFMFFASRWKLLAWPLLAYLGYKTYIGWVPSVWMLYLVCFQIGILVPTAGRWFVGAVRASKILLALSILGIATATNISNLGHMRPTEHLLIEAVASFYILSYVVYGPRIAFLSDRRVKFLGMISYSLYLLHLPVISLVRNTFGFTSQTFSESIACGLLAIPLCILLAWLSYKYIEAPCNAVGRKLGHLVLPSATASRL